MILYSHVANRHNNTLHKNKISLQEFFTNPSTQRQRQYETVRAVIIDQMTTEQAASKFGYAPTTVYSLVRDAGRGKLNLFPEVKKGPKKRRTPEEIQVKIIQYRKKDNLSSPDIHRRLIDDGNVVSTRTIERILKDAGFEKLKRRTNIERGVTNKNKLIPKRSECLDFSRLEPFNLDCPVAGVFFFLPYIIESEILDIVTRCRLPGSKDIQAEQATLSMLLLKLIGAERLSHMERYDHEPGLGIFPGLNVLPKATYMNTYSCRTSEDSLLEFQQNIVERFRTIYPQFYGSKFINLDFHTIPHFGDESEMEKIWCGSRGKALKGANTIFAQDGDSNAILYSRADILRREESEEIKRFVNYWRSLKGDLVETLVFDCKFTRYKVLDELTEEGIQFITLRKRSKKLVENSLNIPREKWKTIKLSIPKRKYNKVSVYEDVVILKDCNNPFRQIIVKDHGRRTPTFIVTNNRKLLLAAVLEVYAKRWHIENKLSELVSFFNLNALSSPLMVRIHFDILWTIIADTFYHRFAQDLRRFESHQAPSIFRKFVNFPGRIVYDGQQFTVRIRKRAYTPILKGVNKLKQPFSVPWLDNRKIEIVWTP